MSRIAYATWRGPDDDRGAVLSALRERGWRAEAVGWHEPVGWSAYDLVLVRSTWDYTPRRDAFVAWLHGVAAVTSLHNPAGVIARNTDKTYLRELAAAGVAVVPTTWIAPGEEVTVPMDRGTDVVVKPHVSGGARDTWRTRSGSEVVQRVGQIHASGRTAMVQPYLPMVEDEGETSLIFLGGAFSHAVRRDPMLVAAPTEDSGLPRDAPDDMRAVARDALAATEGAGDLLSARVDLVRLADGQPVLIELELAEPHLFLQVDPDALGRFADAVAERLP